jgi:cytochrome c5
MNTIAVGSWCLPRGSGLRLAVAACATFSLTAFAHGQNAPKPAFQYQSGDIHVSLPSADEPRVKTFGPESLKAAAKYLEAGAVSWVRERTCVNCHTTGPYMTDFTAWSKRFGKPSEEVHANFVKALPNEIKAQARTARERPVVDAFALPRQLPLHHLHRHGGSDEGAGQLTTVSACLETLDS